MTRSIGLDVHPTTVYVTVLNPSQDKLEQYEFPLETPALEAFLASLRPELLSRQPGIPIISTTASKR